MDQRIRVRGRVSGDDDVEGHAHARVNQRVATKAKSKARKREDEDTEGHAHAKANQRVATKAKSKARKREDEDTAGTPTPRRTSGSPPRPSPRLASARTRTPQARPRQGEPAGRHQGQVQGSQARGRGHRRPRP